jgi:hypothetical protein
MKSFEEIGKSVVALIASASAGLLIGISFYLARESFGYQYRWGSESYEMRVVYALQLGLVGGVALYVFLFRKIRIASGFLCVLLVLLVPAALTAYFLHSATWLVIIPLGIVTLALLVAAIPARKREVSPEQFADELEKHLLGTEGEWDWDDLTSIPFTDERLERIRFALPKFDSLAEEKDKDELRAIIAALRRGERPEVVAPTHVTYRNV